jgi:hypothetical protein
MRFGAIGLAGRLPRGLSCVPGADIRTHDLAAPDYLARFGAHHRPLQRHRV